MNEYIDLYCERTAPEFWNEPFNALTNIAFILAAYFGYKLWKNSEKRSDILILVVLAAMVGIGSFLFHTFANYWSMMADVIPITLFIFTALYSFLRNIAKFDVAKTIFSLMLFFVVSNYFGQFFPENFLNGSIEYVPALLAMIWFSIYSGHKEFCIANVLFITSLTFRSIDNEACPLDPNGIGTHFMWHILNGFVLYYVIKGLIRKAETSD